ncbi:MAG: hypothetical protein Q7Q71_06475 [Verrucomicrobiota bacterium JB023]|nr:hypothetical protein [Verrucomicrobiota bacterium JB023]
MRADERFDPSEPLTEPPLTGTLDDRPTLDISINNDDEATINGITFTEAQLTVIFRWIRVHEPKIVLRFPMARDRFVQYRKIIRIASKEGITDVIFSPLPETKAGERVGTGQPASRSESDLDGFDNTEGKSQG